MIPILYTSDEMAFSSNGIGRLRDCITCEVTEERNGIFECDFEYPIDGAHFDDIICGRIIGVRHDDSQDVQPFDIVSYTKPINGVVEFHAVHVSYRQRGIVAQATNIQSLSDALDVFTDPAKIYPTTSPFTYSADYASTGYCAAFDGTPRSVRQLLGGVEGSILDTFGGEYEWDRFNVILHKNRGQLRDFTIRYGVNLLDYTDDTDYSESYSSIIPYWKGQDENGAEKIVVGSAVSVTGTYNGRDDAAAMDLTEKFDSEPTTTQLENEAQNILDTGKTILPKQNIKVDFVRLQDMGYSDLDALLECNLCDSINVVFPKYNMQGTFKIVRTVFDVLRGEYVEMELGDLSTTLAEALGITQETTGGVTANPTAIVIDQGGTGTQDNWHYRKWSDGTLECWIRYQNNSVNITSTYGQLRYASLPNFSDYPVTFHYYPVLTITGMVSSGNGWVTGNNSNYSVTNPGGIIVYSPASQSGVGVTVNVYAIGRWKA